MNNSAASSAHTTTTTTTTATQQKPKPIRLKTPSSSLLLLGIILASVALRLAAALYLGNSVDSLPGIDDQRSYHMLAQRLLQGHGFTVAENWWPMTMAGEPTAHWSYLYVLFLYAVYSLVGVTPWVARLIQVLIVGVAWPLLAYRITGRILSESDRSVQSLPTAIATWAPLIAAGWSAFYPYFIYYSAGLLTESFYIICVLWVINLSLGIASTLKTQFPPTRLTRYWLLLGLAVAAAVLLRQLFLIVVPCVFVWMAWATRPQSSSAVRVMPMLTQWRAHWSALLRGAACVALILAVCIVPFTALNYQNFHKFVLLNTNAGFAFFWGNHPIYGTQFIEILPNDTYAQIIPAELRTLDEPSLSNALFQLGLKYVIDDPIRYVLLSLSRLFVYFTFWPSPNSGLLSNVTRVTSLGVALPFVLYGLFLSFKQWRSWSLLYVFIVVYVGIHISTWALVRYRLPVDAVLLVFAAYGLANLFYRLRQHRDRKHSSRTLHIGQNLRQSI